MLLTYSVIGLADDDEEADGKSEEVGDSEEDTEVENGRASTVPRVGATGSSRVEEETVDDAGVAT